MSAWDDDDWTGSRPRDTTRGRRQIRASGRENRAPLSITGIGLGVALIILLIVWLL